MSKPLNILPQEPQEEKKPWYAEGLCFSCTGCGGCCTGAPGFVWITEEEIQAMAEFLNLSSLEFMRRYVRLVNGRYSLTERRVTYDCVFLEDGKRCKIYSVRPVQCRTFPFWPENLASPEAWQAAKAHCEGIHEQASRVELEEIEKQRARQLQADGA